MEVVITNGYSLEVNAGEDKFAAFYKPLNNLWGVSSDNKHLSHDSTLFLKSIEDDRSGKDNGFVELRSKYSEQELNDVYLAFRLYRKNAPSKSSGTHPYLIEHFAVRDITKATWMGEPKGDSGYTPLSPLYILNTKIILENIDAGCYGNGLVVQVGLQLPQGSVFNRHILFLHDPDSETDRPIRIPPPEDSK